MMDWMRVDHAKGVVEIDLVNQFARDRAKLLIDNPRTHHGMVTFSASRKTKKQNDHVHPLIRDISKQVRFEGAMRGEQWWRNFLCGLFAGQDVVYLPGHETPIVVNKESVSGMKKPRIAEFIDFLLAFGTEHRVTWSKPPEKE